ncbi:MAG: hypothetical protein MR873_09015 [Parabacteroides sp.]|nr:hypothetical protein [Parabacteroides sp.]MDY3142186.1 transcription termination/antitermination NusG family protein [Parabacteroides sp.]
MWYVVYRGTGSRADLEIRLLQEGITYFLPTYCVEKLNAEGTEMVIVQELAIQNLVFIQCDQIEPIIREVDGLRAPLLDTMTGEPAQIADVEMEMFMRLLRTARDQVKLLHDPITKFAQHPQVRVKAGLFEGVVGYVVRILRDRKLVISLGNMAVAISGIHRSLLEVIEN